MSRELWRVLLLAGVAWLIESYDIGIIGNILPSLQRQFKMDATTVGFIATASTIGIVLSIAPAGYFADRFGRKKLLIVGTAWYALCSLVAGLAQSPGEIIALRFVGGLGMGMVFPIPYALAAEFMPRHFRGAAAGLLDAFLSGGYLLASGVAYLTITHLVGDAGWRWPFLVGGLALVFVPALAIWLPESPRWLETQGRSSEAERIVRRIEAAVERRLGKPLPQPAATHRPRRGLEPRRGPEKGSPLQLVRGEYRTRTLMMWIAFSGLIFIFYAVQTYMPTVLVNDGQALGSALLITALVIGVSIFGKFADAWAVEKIGRKRVIVLFGGVSALAAAVFGLVHHYHFLALAIPLGMVMSFFGIGVDPAIKIYGAEQYPTRFRETGIGFTEGVGRLIGGVVGPFILSFFVVSGGASGSFFFVGVVALIGVLAVVFLGRETRGKTLELAAEAETSAAAA